MLDIREILRRLLGPNPVSAGSPSSLLSLSRGGRVRGSRTRLSLARRPRDRRVMLDSPSGVVDTIA